MIFISNNYVCWYIQWDAFFKHAYFAGGTLYKVIRGVFIVVVAMLAVYTDMLFVDIDGWNASCDFVCFCRESLIASHTAMLESSEPLMYFSLK